MKTKSRRAPKQSLREKLDAQLAQLENAQLIRRDTEGEPTFAFRHTLTQEAAYESLLLKERHTLHQHVAQTFEILYPERLDELAAPLAQHYAEAGDSAKALEYSIRAGDVASRVYAHNEAVDHYNRALQAADRCTAATEQLKHIFTRRGRAFELAGNYVRALANYEEMERVARERNDRLLELEGLMLRATAYAVGAHIRDWKKAQELSEQALALARELGDRAAEARIYWNLLLVNRFGNEGAEKAVEYGSQSLAIARELGLKEQEALTLKDLQVAYITNGQIQSMRANAAETLRLWRELDNKPMLAEVLAGATSMHFMAGQIEQAVSIGEESCSISESIGNRWGLSVSAAFLSVPYRELGLIARSIEMTEQSVGIAAELGIAVAPWVALVELAVTFGFLGDFSRAFEYAQRAIASPLNLGDKNAIYPRAVLARLSLRQGDPTTAAQWLAPYPVEPFDVYQHWNANGLVPSTILSAYAEIAVAQEDTARALTIVDDLLRTLHQMEMALPLPSVLQLKAQVFLAQGDPGGARALLLDARARAETMQSRFRLLPILVALDQVEAQLGNAAEAQAARVQAREVIDYIATNAPPDIRDSFRALPDVREIMDAA
jgi:tetratricopeptide (TPR) repeat protein